MALNPAPSLPLAPAALGKKERNMDSEGKKLLFQNLVTYKKAKSKRASSFTDRNFVLYNLSAHSFIHSTFTSSTPYKQAQDEALER